MKSWSSSSSWWNWRSCIVPKAVPVTSSRCRGNRRRSLLCRWWSRTPTTCLSSCIMVRDSLSSPQRRKSSTRTKRRTRWCPRYLCWTTRMNCDKLIDNVEWTRHDRVCRMRLEGWLFTKPWWHEESHTRAYCDVPQAWLFYWSDSLVEINFRHDFTSYSLLKFFSFKILFLIFLFRAVQVLCLFCCATEARR